jgi:hypothetical protein
MVSASPCLICGPAAAAAAADLSASAGNGTELLASNGILVLVPYFTLFTVIMKNKTL